MSRILVVEDDALVRDNLEEILDALNYQAIPAATAKEAISILQSHQDFNLILCDIMTPDGDGFDVLSLNPSDEEGFYLMKELQMMRLTLEKFKVWLEK